MCQCTSSSDHGEHDWSEACPDLPSVKVRVACSCGVRRLDVGDFDWESTLGLPSFLRFLLQWFYVTLQQFSNLGSRYLGYEQGDIHDIIVVYSTSLYPM